MGGDRVIIECSLDMRLWAAKKGPVQRKSLVGYRLYNNTNDFSLCARAFAFIKSINNDHCPLANAFPL